MLALNLLQLSAKHGFNGSLMRLLRQPLSVCTIQNADFHHSLLVQLQTIVLHHGRALSVPSPACRLIFAGKQMSDEKAAKDFNIEGGSVLHLVRASQSWRACCHINSFGSESGASNSCFLS